MLKELIDNLNNILTKVVLILHISEEVTCVKAAIKVRYSIYLKERDTEPLVFYSSFRIKKLGSDNKSIEKEIMEEVLKLIIEGELKKYE